MTRFVTKVERERFGRELAVMQDILAKLAESEVLKPSEQASIRGMVRGLRFIEGAVERRSTLGVEQGMLPDFKSMAAGS